MSLKRVIPFLMLHDQLLYKSINFKHFNYIGDPLVAVKIFNEKKAQEICIVDTDVSRNNSKINFTLLKDIASECFMPLSYGGGVNSLEDIRKLNSIGYEKIILNTIVHTNKKLVKEAVKEFGSSTIIGCLDYKKINNQYNVFSHCGKVNTNSTISDILEFYNSCEVGEIFLNNIDRDGTLQGIDFSVFSEVIKNTSAPIMYSGGAESLEDISECFKLGINAVAAGSLFVYKGPLKAVLVNYPDREKLKKILT